MRRAAAIAFALFLVAPVARAAGDVAGDEQEARTAMRRGRDALERGDAEGALAEYERAKGLAPAANAPWYFAAEALERLQRWPEAVASLEGYLRLDPTVSDAAPVKDRVARLRAAHFPARLRVVVDTPGAMVSIDRGAPSRPGELELSPGKHHVEASAPAFEPVEQDVDLVGDTSSTITLVLPHMPEPRRPAPVEAPRKQDGLPWRTIGWVTAGVGAAGFATTFILDATALRARIVDYRGAAFAQNEARAARLLHQVDDTEQGLLVGYIVSASVGIGGLALGLLGPRQARDESATLVPWLAPGSGGLMITGRR